MWLLKKITKLLACQLLLHIHHGVVLGVKHMCVITRRGERGHRMKEFFVRVHFVYILLCVASCILRVHFRIRRINSVVWCSVSMKFYQRNKHTYTSLQFNLIFKGKDYQYLNSTTYQKWSGIAFWAAYFLTTVWQNFFPRILRGINRLISPDISLAILDGKSLSRTGIQQSRE